MLLYDRHLQAKELVCNVMCDTKPSHMNRVEWGSHNTIGLVVRKYKLYLVVVVGLGYIWAPKEKFFSGSTSSLYQINKIKLFLLNPF